MEIASKEADPIQPPKSESLPEKKNPVIVREIDREYAREFLMKVKVIIIYSTLLF